MSTAVAEPPVITEPITQAAPVETPTQPTNPAPVKLEGDVLDWIRQSNAKPAMPVSERKPEPVIEPPKEEPKAEAKVEPPIEKKEEPKIEKAPAEGTKEANMAELRKAREAAEKLANERTEELAKLKAELETYRGRPATEEVQKEREELTKQITELRGNLKSAALQRDPEFQAKYDKSIIARQEEMVRIAVGAGIDQKEALAAVRSWNTAQFREWGATMDPLTVTQFGGAMNEVVRLDQERGVELQNADQRWEARQKEREAQSKEEQAKYEREFRGEAKTVVDEFFSKPELENNAELRAEVEAQIKRATMLDEDRLSRREVLQRVAGNVILSRIAEAQQTEIQQLRASVAEQAKKLAEQEAFIAEQSGGQARVGDSATIGKKDEKFVAPWDNLVIKT